MLSRCRLSLSRLSEIGASFKLRYILWMPRLCLQRRQSCPSQMHVKAQTPCPARPLSEFHWPILCVDLLVCCPFHGSRSCTTCSACHGLQFAQFMTFFHSVCQSSSWCKGRVMASTHTTGLTRCCDEVITEERKAQATEAQVQGMHIGSTGQTDRPCTCVSVLNFPLLSSGVVAVSPLSPQYYHRSSLNWIGNKRVFR